MQSFRLWNVLVPRAGCSWHLQRPVEAMLLWVWNADSSDSATEQQLPSQTHTSRARKSGRKSIRRKIAGQHAASSGKQRPATAQTGHCDAAAAADGWAVADTEPADIRPRFSQDQSEAFASRTDATSAWIRPETIRSRSSSPTCSDASVTTSASTLSGLSSPASVVGQIAIPALVGSISAGHMSVNKEHIASDKLTTSARRNRRSARNISGSKANASCVHDSAGLHEVLGKQVSGKKPLSAPRHSGISQFDPVRPLTMESRLSLVGIEAEDKGPGDDLKQPSKGQSTVRYAVASGPGSGTATKHTRKNSAAMHQHATDAELHGLPQGPPAVPKPPTDGAPPVGIMTVTRAPADGMAVKLQTECSQYMTTEHSQGPPTPAIWDRMGLTSHPQPPPLPANLLPMPKHHSDVMDPSPVAECPSPMRCQLAGLISRTSSCLGNQISRRQMQLLQQACSRFSPRVAGPNLEACSTSGMQQGQQET